MSSAPGPHDELGRVLRERDALDQQIKLLVATEQRLYRSQNELDAQLERIRALADYSLTCSSFEFPGEILDRALELLSERFDARLAIAIEIDPERPGIWNVRTLETLVDRKRVLQVDGATSAWAEALPRASTVSASELPAIAQLDQLLAPMAPAGRTAAPGQPVACMALRPLEGRLSALLLAAPRRARGSNHWLDDQEGAPSPFLDLVALHVEHAVRNASLSADVRSQAQQLTKTNLQLTRSLQTLESAQRQLVEAQKMEAIGRLAGGVAHDFNNLLTVILNHAELLGASAHSEGAIKDHALAIGEAGKRAAKITAQLLAFGRKQRHAPEPIDVNELVSQMNRMFWPLLGDGIAQDLQLDPGLAPLHADPAQLEQVLLNLVLNARDAMPDGGVLGIHTRPARDDDCDELLPRQDPGRFVALVVEDTGHGMDEETRRQVFEPFFTTKPSGRGTGLGLATVYGLVRQHGGHVVVKSEPGRGASFRVLLPATPRRTDPDPDGGEQDVTILLVDDEEGIRTFAARALRREGFEVLEAADGDEALQLMEARGTGVDLVITDVVMPRCGGFELARRLRARDPRQRVLYTSGHAQVPEEESSNADLESMLVKPFTASQFLRRVHERLRSPAPGP